jgi:hypothetical protein
MVELTDELRRPVERMNPTIPVIADVQQMPTDGATAIDDIEFSHCEISIRRPMVRHHADVPALVNPLTALHDSGRASLLASQRITRLGRSPTAVTTLRVPER